MSAGMMEVFVQAGPQNNWPPGPAASQGSWIAWEWAKDASIGGATSSL